MIGFLENKDSIKWPTPAALDKLCTNVPGNDVLTHSGVDSNEENTADFQVEWNNFLENEVKKKCTKPCNLGPLNTKQICRRKILYLQQNQPAWKIAESMKRKQKDFRAFFQEMNRILDDNITDLHCEAENMED